MKRATKACTSSIGATPAACPADRGSAPATPASGWRRVRVVAGTALIALLLSGCAAVGPDYSKPHVAVPENWHAAHQAGPVDADALAKWWTRLNDPVLERLITEALASNTDLAAARARLRQARALRALAGAQFYPTISASGSAQHSKFSGTTGAAGSRNYFSAGFDAAWEPDIFGGLRRGAEAAQADLEATEASLHATQVSLVAEVAVNDVELRAYQGRLAIARANEATQAQTLQIAEWRAQAGLVTSLDVEQARTNLEQTRASILPLETSVAETKNRLAVLLGKTPGSLNALLDPPENIPAVPEAVAVGIPADTLRQRPDVRAAERTLAAETARIGVAEANRYPNLALSGSFGLESLTLGGLTGGNATAGSLLANLAGTVFDGGRLKQQVEVQSAVQAQALAAYQAAVLTALSDVENALTALANGRWRVQALRVAAQSAANAEQLAQQQYAAGLVDFETVLTSQRTLLSVQDSLKSSEADTATSLIQLYKALGGGWSNTPQSAQPRPE